ncbi:MAG TPA: isochorismatase family cysteine hydrolase [Candidatus Polarisedimenticolaceae bacterium]|nr:isochorismatase family cysteine hydrolase [Candidatus Polarisedimenticolaceae bacterium]
MKSSDETDPKFLNIDPLRKSYTERIVENVEQIEALRARNVALLCIDLQYLDAAPGHGVFREAEKSGVPLEAQAFYFSTLEHTVLPNVRRLQDVFRDHRLEVIHVRICSLTRDGRDRSTGHRRLGLLAAPGSREADFIERVAPLGDEIVINKTASGVFNSTNIEYVLRNIGVDSLFVTGVYTDECISTTVRDANDRGFFVTVIEDGCATVTPDRHDFTIATLRDRYTRVLTTERAIDEISRHVDADAS